MCDWPQVHMEALTCERCLACWAPSCAVQACVLPCSAGLIIASDNMQGHNKRKNIHDIIHQDAR